MSQAEVSKLVSKLRYNVKTRRKLSCPEGPQGRHNKMRKVVTALLKYERIELNYPIGDESRGYAERLISDAIKYGECHKETMKMASYWLIEKQVVHKLFKVLAPRYKDFKISYTKMWRAPSQLNFDCEKCVLELRNNIYPSLSDQYVNHDKLLHNVLLSEAKKEYNKQKALKLLEELNKDLKTDTSSVVEDVPNNNKPNELVNAENLNLDNLKIVEVNASSTNLASDNEIEGNKIDVDNKIDSNDKKIIKEDEK